MKSEFSVNGSVTSCVAVWRGVFLVHAWVINATAYLRFVDERLCPYIQQIYAIRHKAFTPSRKLQKLNREFSSLKMLQHSPEFN